MANEVVKYHNDLNTVSMRNWTKEQMNFFFSVVAKTREQGIREVEFTKEQLTSLAQYSDMHNERFEKTIEDMVLKLSELKYIERTTRSLRVMTLFSLFEVKWTENLSEINIRVKTSEEFEYVLNQLQANFTIWELSQFTKIRSTYAKTMYRLIKQWRTEGKKEYKLDEFKQLLAIPKTYSISKIDQVVLAPIKKELPAYFKGLKIKKLKSNQKGTPVTGYEFTWQAEQTGTWEESKFDPDKTSSQRKETLPDWATDTSVPLTKLEQSIYKEWYAEQMAQYDITIAEFLETKGYAGKEKSALQRALKKIGKEQA
ncbi:replication initiation protein (plasmid) [Carnobacterium maltaromaticum]|uniref:replication initiation protein n=1 Tax=Carnobacterium maltaromaticum TaxID=2751 RepID=UPI00344DACAA